MDAARVRNRVHRAFGLVAVVAVVAVLAGCSGGSGAEHASPAQTSSAASSPAASASPSSSLTAAEQKAFEEATSVVLAYRQTIADLYSGARTDLNDLDKVATGEKLDRELMNVSRGLAQGYRSEPPGVRLQLIASEPVELALQADPARLVVRACVDASAVVDISPDGTRTPGLREELEYTLVVTPYLPPPGWAVTATAGRPDPQDRRC